MLLRGMLTTTPTGFLIGAPSSNDQKISRVRRRNLMKDLEIYVYVTTLFHERIVHQSFE